MSRTFTKRDLRKYLESLEPEAEAGACRTSDHCPIAQALLDRYPKAEYVYVYPGYAPGGKEAVMRVCYTKTGSTRTYYIESPDAKDLARFIDGVDCYPKPAISAAAALAILEALDEPSH